MTVNKGSGPSEAIDLSQYRDDGVLVIKQILSRDVADGLTQGWQELRNRIADGTIARQARFVSGSLPGTLAALYRDSNLVHIAQDALGTTDVALYMNRLLLKDEQWSGAVAIHQDAPYFSGGCDKVSVFVPLAPMTARNGNGGLIFLKGSQKYGNLQRGTVRRESFPPLEEMGPDLEVGDAVLMNFLTWHYSENADIPSDRPLMQITYQPASDGSYGTAKLGVIEPTLVSGKWLTKHFAPYGDSTIPDA